MWIITRDFLDDGTCDIPSRVGVHSNDYDADRFAKANTLEIRLLDDDGEVYYEGRATRKRILHSSEEYAFEVLDWAMADAGCTELQYFDGGEWQTL
jgi:hypothetical protein